LRIVGRAAVIAAVGLLLAPGAPNAHEEQSLGALTVLDSVRPRLEGLDVKVVHLGAPALVVRNDSDRRLLVMGVDGERFLRIGPDGVYANASSPTTYRSVDPKGGQVPSHLAARSRWIRLSTGSTWSWFDPRLRSEKWSVPMSVGGTTVIASGSLEPLNGHGHFVTAIDVPDVEGLEIRVAQGPVPGLFVRNTTSETLHVAGAEGEPMLRIGPSGVYGNLASPSYYRSAAQGIRPIPRGIDAEPSWKKLSGAPIWAWLEPRAAVPAELQQRSQLGPREEVVLTWRSPLRLGDRPVAIEGSVTWMPPHTTVQSTAEWLPLGNLWPVIVGVAAGTLALAALLARRRPATT
jgi:hypothetical protein